MINEIEAPKLTRGYITKGTIELESVIAQWTKIINASQLYQM